MTSLNVDQLFEKNIGLCVGLSIFDIKIIEFPD